MNLLQRLLFPLATSLAVAFATAGCESDGGEGTRRVIVHYSGDAPAYGISIEADAAAAAAASAESPEAGSCTMSAAATEAGCTANIATTANSVNLTLFRCSVDVGDALFDCDLSDELIEGLKSDATVHGGCGCQTCPAAPAIAVCEGDAPECEEDLLAVSHGSQRPSTVVTTQRGARGTTCSTCCETDFYEDEIGTAISDEALTEIAFEVVFSPECGFDLNGAAECEVVDQASEHWEVVRATESPLVKRFCFAGRSPGDQSLSVPLVSCRGDIDAVPVTRAIGLDFTPVTNAPIVRFE